LSKGQELRKATASESRETARGLVADILVKVETRKAYADVLLDQTLKAKSLSSPDRALLTELTYGTLRWRGRLDAHLAPLLRRPLEKTDPFLKNLLRLSLYQFIFLDRIPDYAAVNEAVELTKSRAGGKAGGFVNGVLRNFLREAKQVAKPDLKESPINAVAEYWSHPDWLVEKWLRYFSTTETEALLQANNQEAPLVLRTNLRHGTREGLLELFQSRNIQASPAPWSPQGITVQSKGLVENLPGFHEGNFQVQGEASQLVAYLLDPQPGERILDACAAPGGKTTQIAELMDDRGVVVATDVSAKGLKRLQENAIRLRLESIRAFQADLSKPLSRSLSQPFDRILIDAPCSGFGTLRSHPEIKWNRGEADIKRLSELQEKILVNAASNLKPGGVLVYSTCTLIDDENERVVKTFLQQQKEFVLDGATAYLPQPARSLVRDNYFMALPHKHNTDGFFAARMRKLG
jgi:16S rRNA (cytosine967-C5)-methyltransferase